MMRTLAVFAIFALVTAEEVLVSSKTTQTTISSVELCGPEPEIELTKTGENSSRIVTLTPIDSNLCKLRITASKTHAINLQFIDEDEEDPPLLPSKHQPCVMSIFLPENYRVPVWKGDLCARTAPSPPDLLTADIKLMWQAPQRLRQRARRFAVTAVGRGAVCKDQGQHTCMRIGWDPILCVADALVCDGVANCPSGATHSDEDDRVCAKPFFSASSLEQLAVEILKKWKPATLRALTIAGKEAHGDPKQALADWRDWKDVKQTPATTKRPLMKPKPTDSVSQVLSKYGPWGYLMLGMLICGTVLMFCGLWECCFRRPKSEAEAPPAQQPTTVLIINEVPNPPNYDELDQPPAYTTLFPHKNPTTSEEPNGAPEEVVVVEDEQDHT